MGLLKNYFSSYVFINSYLFISPYAVNSFSDRTTMRTAIVDDDSKFSFPDDKTLFCRSTPVLTSKFFNFFQFVKFVTFCKGNFYFFVFLLWVIRCDYWMSI